MLPSPSLTIFESPGGFQWLPTLWDTLQEFNVDQPGPEIPQLPLNAFGDQFVML
jgi:hypothetical protein